MSQLNGKLIEENPYAQQQTDQCNQPQYGYAAFPPQQPQQYPQYPQYHQYPQYPPSQQNQQCIQQQYHNQNDVSIVIQNQPYSYQLYQLKPDDPCYMVLVIMCTIFVPICGFIAYCVTHKTYPKSAKTLLVANLVIIGIYVIFIITVRYLNYWY